VSFMERGERNPVLWLVFAVIFAVGLTALFTALLAPYQTGYGMMGWGMGWGASFMVLPALLLVFLLLAALGAFTASPSRTPSLFAPPAPSAVEILDARYARGEISRDEYLRIRADLERHMT